MSERDQLKEIIEAPLGEMAYSSHPSESLLRDYIAGRLRGSRKLDVVGLQSGSLPSWHRAEITAHILTCRRCAHLVAELRQEPSQLRSLLRRLIPSHEPVPAFARAVMLAQLVIILGLVGIIYFKPELFFSSLSPTASVIPAPEITKPRDQAPQTPHPQVFPSDPIPQLVQAYPQTIHVVFHQDTPMRELTDLMGSINGILIFVHQQGFVVRLPPDDQLDSIMEKLTQSPYILEVRKD